jgi:putative PIN family toxin of toxin-antitoxin system
MRVVVDTNVWISALINPKGRPAEIIDAFANGHFSVVSSNELLAELKDVLQRPRMRSKYGIGQPEIEALDQLIRSLADVVDIPGTLRLCRDPDDDAVIETAVVGLAQYVVSRDEDLMRVPELAEALSVAGIEFVTVQTFLADVLRQSSD